LKERKNIVTVSQFRMVWSVKVDILIVWVNRRLQTVLYDSNNTVSLHSLTLWSKAVYNSTKEGLN